MEIREDVKEIKQKVASEMTKKSKKRLAVDMLSNMMQFDIQEQKLSEPEFKRNIVSK